MRGRREPSEPDPWAAADPALALAAQQLGYYARHRDRSRKAYVAGETVILVTTAATTLAAALAASPWLTAGLAALALIVAGMKRILNWHDGWLAYGGAWANLHVAVNEYRLASLDGTDPQAQRKLIDKVNTVISDETSAWAARRRAAADKGADQR